MISMARLDRFASIVARTLRSAGAIATAGVTRMSRRFASRAAIGSVVSININPSRLRTSMGKRLLLILVITMMIGFANTRLPAQSAPAWLDPYRDPAARLIGEATGDTFAWNRLS